MEPHKLAGCFENAVRELKKKRKKVVLESARRQEMQIDSQIVRCDAILAISQSGQSSSDSYSLASRCSESHGRRMEAVRRPYGSRPGFPVLSP